MAAKLYSTPTPEITQSRRKLAGDGAVMARGDTEAGGVGTEPFPMTKASRIIASLNAADRAMTEAEFWEQTEWDLDTGCLFWTGGRAGAGCRYGYARIAGEPVGAHVAAFVFAHGPIPKKWEVRHGPTCEGHDRLKGRLCVNPEHLAIGTRAENMADRNGGWFREELDNIPMSGWQREAAKAFLSRALSVPDGPTESGAGDELGTQATERDRKGH